MTIPTKVSLTNLTVVAATSGQVFVIPANLHRRYLMLEFRGGSGSSTFRFGSDPDGGVEDLRISAEVLLIFDKVVPTDALHIRLASAGNACVIYEGECAE